jgi:hypothetical protein
MSGNILQIGMIVSITINTPNTISRYMLWRDIATFNDAYAQIAIITTQQTIRIVLIVFVHLHPRAFFQELVVFPFIKTVY